MMLLSSGSFLHMPTVANKLLEVMTHSLSPRSLRTALNYENDCYTQTICTTGTGLCVSRCCIEKPEHRQNILYITTARLFGAYEHPLASVAASTPASVFASVRVCSRLWLCQPRACLRLFCACSRLFAPVRVNLPVPPTQPDLRSGI